MATKKLVTKRIRISHIV